MARESAVAAIRDTGQCRQLNDGATLNMRADCWTVEVYSCCGG